MVSGYCEGRLGQQRLPGRRIKAMVRLGLETDIPLVLHPMSRELQAHSQSWDSALTQRTEIEIHFSDDHSPQSPQPGTVQLWTETPE